MTENKRITIRDVAARAQVSVTTVSRVMNDPTGTEQVRDSTRRRVLRAIEELDYNPARAAQRLRRDKAGVVGLLVPDISNPFFSALARGAEGAAFDAGLSLLICDSNQSSERERRYLSILREERVDGIVLIPTGDQNADYISRIRDKGIQVILADRVISGFAYAKAQNEEASYELTRYVLDQGYRHPIYISGPKSVSTAMEREAGFVRAVEDYGVPRVRIEHGSFTYRSGYDIAATLHCRRTYDVVMAGNDLMAMGVIRALENQNLRVPQDVAVTGFDCTLWSDYFKPRLSTVRVPAAKIGEEAIGLMKSRDQLACISIPCEIVHGETVKGGAVC